MADDFIKWSRNAWHCEMPTSFPVLKSSKGASVN